MGDRAFGRFSVAVVTPFVDFDKDVNQPVDEIGLKAVIDHVAKGLKDLQASNDLVGGIIVSGTTGEQHTMTVDERVRLYQRSVEFANEHSVPVIAGVAGTTISAVTTLARAAVDAGCKGIMLGLPPYCRLCDEEIRSYIMSVKATVADSSFPILLYNNALRNGYGPSLSLLAELCRDNTLWGVKFAVSPDDFMPQSHELLRLYPDIRLYTGSDKMAGDLLDYSGIALMPGTQQPFPRYYGLTSIAGNLFAEAMGAAVLQLSSGNPEGAELGRGQHQRLVPLLDAMLLGVSLPAGLKLAMRLRGLGAGYTRRPVGHVSEEKRAQIEAALAQYTA